MLKQLLRNNDVLFDTYIVPSQLNAVVAAKAPTQACNDAVQQKGLGHVLGPVHLGVGGSGSRTHHGRNEVGRGIGAVGGHEVRSEGSAREKVLETSMFFWRRRERTRDGSDGQ